MLTFHGVVKIAPDSFLQAYVLVSFISLKNLTSILVLSQTEYLCSLLCMYLLTPVGTYR